MSRKIVLECRFQSGGYGDLYLARLGDNGERVVVKYLREANNPDARRAFAREVRILRTGIAGLVPILHADLQAPSPYYVMSFLPGGPLTPWAGRLSAPQLEIVAVQLAYTLQQLHSAAISHGDIKPDNVLLDPGGNCRVADPLGNGWGCTVLFASNRGGTPGYWAPEVKRGDRISPPADAYSLGASLFHLATGQRPLDGQRLDLLIDEQGVSTRIREVIRACCIPTATGRPCMGEVLRMLQGETWASIKKRRSDGLKILVGLGLVAGFCALLTSEQWSVSSRGDR